MLQLTPDESRVLGVLIEKATTTPEQYPLSLNAVVNGANQKNNRDPVMSMDESAAFEALESLRGKGLVIRSDMAGSRVNKYKHAAAEALRMRPGETAILAELLLRGPQTLGELRGRASRMHPFESLEVVKQMLAALSEREEPLVRELPPMPGSRAERYAQLLCPEAQEAQAAGTGEEESEISNLKSGISDLKSAASESPALVARVAALESEVTGLRDALRRLAQSIGEPDPFPSAATTSPTYAPRDQGTDE
ncbi:MAG TPA: YceH family protein [Tepidisphaeraceae bacterium]|jgi:hypothetical protein|nr:YceH family protein [Tepidisphaeraceae bacterium]